MYNQTRDYKLVCECGFALHIHETARDSEKFFEFEDRCHVFAGQSGWVDTTCPECIKKSADNYPVQHRKV